MSEKKIIPKHIAIIMDGNGRWAKERKLPRIAGHRKGAEVVKSIVKCCDDLGVKFLTLYTFSTENWKRPEKEINFLMGLLSWFLDKEIRNLKKNNARFLTIGNIERLPKKAREVIAKAKEQTKSNTGLNLVLALNYGARLEIIEAVKSICGDIKDKRLTETELNEDIFSGYLYTAGIPDPDLLIRTGGEMRLSNFLLWQCAYSEIMFLPDILWPEFSKQDLMRCVEEFKHRKRRFGK